MRKRTMAKDAMMESIMQSCLILMEQKSFSKITISEIIQQADVNRSVYYRNFKSKECIIRLFFKQVFDEYLTTIKQQNPPTVAAYSLIMFECFYKYKKEFLLISKNRLFFLFLETADLRFKNKLKGSPSTLANEYTQCYHLGGMYNLLNFWILRNMQDTPEQMIEVLIGMEKITLLGSEIQWYIGSFRS